MCRGLEHRLARAEISATVIYRSIGKQRTTSVRYVFASNCTNSSGTAFRAMGVDPVFE